MSPRHSAERLGWLRAAVLGANDGLLSTSSLIVGVASAAGTHASVLVAAVAGLAAGSMSMAAGEYVSVSSQSDSERADGDMKPTAQPIHAALASGLAFLIGAALPLVMVVVMPPNALIIAVCAASLAFLAVLGAAGAKIGGAPPLKAIVRVTFWGALALAVTAGIGAVFARL